MNPLEQAIREDNVHQFRLLLDLGHDVKSISIYDLIKKGALKCLSYLIDKRYDVSDVELIRTFLFLKDPEETHVKILRLLLEHGATVDQDTYDPFSEPPIVTIAEKGNLNEYHIEIVELLLKSGMDPDRTDIEHFPLHTALYAILSYNGPINNIQEKFAKVLIENGANIEAESPYGDTPLFWAAKANAVEIAQMLIKRGKNVNATDESGNTPLFDAAHFDAKEVAELLIANGAYINTKNIRGQTALFECAIGNSLKVAKLLIKKGANVDERDENCKTPLFLSTKEMP